MNKEKQRTQGAQRPSFGKFLKKRSLTFWKSWIFCIFAAQKGRTLSRTSAVRLVWAMLTMTPWLARCTSMATMPPRMPMRTTAWSSIERIQESEPSLSGEHKQDDGEARRIMPSAILVGVNLQTQQIHTFTTLTRLCEE